MNTDYINRLMEKELERRLNSSGCVLVSGPKFCGKSTLCERYAKSSIGLKTSNAIKLAEADPISILNGDNPRLIDEWQKVPELWNYIRDNLDSNYQFGKFIITGSTTPLSEKQIQHSGAGRITSLTLKPFTLYESKESSGIVSIRDLFDNPNSNIQTRLYEDNNTSLEDIAFYLCRGGWPISVKADKEYALDVTENYYNGLFKIEDESDEFVQFLKNKDIDLLMLVLKSIARNISTQTKKTKMIKDILESGVRSTLDEDTFNNYLKTLKDLFIVHECPAWNLNLRTSISVRTTPTYHFYDTSIATCALGIKPNDLLNDLNSFGYFFEDMAVRDLSVYTQSLKGTLKHYRDSSGQEVDSIIELPNGEYAAIEIKIYSEKNVEEGINSLLSFENKLIKSNLKTPLFKMVLTSHGPCYKDENGIFVVPINYLKD